MSRERKMEREPRTVAEPVGVFSPETEALLAEARRGAEAWRAEESRRWWSRVVRWARREGPLVVTVW